MSLIKNLASSVPNGDIVRYSKETSGCIRNEEIEVKIGATTLVVRRTVSRTMIGKLAGGGTEHIAESFSCEIKFNDGVVSEIDTEECGLLWATAYGSYLKAIERRLEELGL